MFTLLTSISLKLVAKDKTTFVLIFPNKANTKTEIE